MVALSAGVSPPAVKTPIRFRFMLFDTVFRVLGRKPLPATRF